MLTLAEIEQTNREAHDRLLTELRKTHPLAILPRWMTDTDERNTQ